MLGISGLGISYYENPYSSVYASRAAQRSADTQAAQANTSTQAASKVTVIPAAQTGVPVQAVDAVRAPSSVQLDKTDMLRQLESDPAALAVRSRMEYVGIEKPGTLQGPEQTVGQTGLPGADESNLAGSIQTEAFSNAYNMEDAIGMPPLLGVDSGKTPMDIPGAVPTPYDTDFPVDEDDEADLMNQGKIAGLSDEAEAVDGEKSKSAQEIMEENECQTCKNRKYQDGSDDPGVSFKTPTHISPEMAASEVRGHEMEHVTRNQAEAQRDGREVISQSVTYHTAICPECGRVYVSGGTTRTVTGAEQSQDSTYDNQTANGEDDDAQNELSMFGAA